VCVCVWCVRACVCVRVCVCVWSACACVCGWCCVGACVRYARACVCVRIVVYDLTHQSTTIPNQNQKRSTPMVKRYPATNLSQQQVRAKISGHYVSEMCFGMYQSHEVTKQRCRGALRDLKCCAHTSSRTPSETAGDPPDGASNAFDT
jgi:hypothetical protein